MKAIKIRPLISEETEKIPSLIQSGIRADIYPLTIYSSEKYKFFVDDTMKQAKTKFIGAFHKDTLLGFAEWRLNDVEIFLNNIYIKGSHRGLGIGTQLLEYGLSQFRTPTTRYFSLDVFDNNQNAKLWYERIGMEKQHVTYWHIAKQRRLETNNGLVLASVSNLKDADEQHTKYGFSMLQISTENGNYEIGRITNDYYRIHQSEALSDEQLRLKLNEMNPYRKLLFLSKSSNVNGFKAVCTSNRMKAKLTHQLGGLNGYQTLGS
ncbi:GNAT family N-acetyltransferase [Guptibacillus hwajinpoensis]|uniref:GNAT family N-acetyltransferase n=1 Tax=Guptibacillus hwajinpoensis TaxID=208199 RepID=UPI001CFE2D5B|nr:GNAT family N-acetyltransferase [Pseudalkalibacillus hwajinpoensis]WLR61506.1 GNAT family N-acetyltransferase [Pseudalkalibacillus hwajinpoensis]